MQSNQRKDRPGISFEKAVAHVQAQFDSAATVTHNEVIADRLGHRRQFDVAIRGTFAGQAILGVIECKDLKRKVGPSEIDAFVTKSQDVNANVRVFMARRGFTRKALQKCSHYGIQALSLLGHDPPDARIFLGIRWEAQQKRWGRIAVTLRYVNDPVPPVKFSAELLSIEGKKVIDWFTNYLLEHEPHVKELGWVVNIGIEFSKPQLVELQPGVAHMCRAIEFHAERVCDRFERMVGVSGTGFYDWNAGRATFPPGSTISTEPVTMDFLQWTPIVEGANAPPGFLNALIVTRAIQFQHVADAIDLEAL
jgi:hypothetical protein